jgi:hypothetical protein
MSKRLILGFIIVIDLAALLGGSWLFWMHRFGLQDRGLDGVVLLTLIMVGVVNVMMPLHLSANWDSLTPLEMLREWGMRGGLLILTMFGIGLAFVAGAWLIMLPAMFFNSSWAVLIWLTLLVPLVMVLIDLFQKNYKRNMRNFGLGYALYTFRIYGMLAIQFTIIPVAFALFPAGFFIQFLSLFDLGMRLFGHPIGDLPMLCNWTGVSNSICPQTVFGLHVGHLILAGLAAYFGETIFNKMSDGYVFGLKWLEEQIEGVEGGK